MNHRKTATFREGQRVQFQIGYERQPYFAIPAGSTAVVNYVDDHLLSLTMDEPIRGLERSENQVDFEKAEFDTAARVLLLLSDP
jgi:hypothetical protein